MMSTAPVTRLMTAEEFWDFCQLPENADRHFELEDGEIVEMAQPTIPHGVVCANVVRILGNYTFARRRGFVCSNDTGVIWKRRPDTVRGPDILLFDDTKAFNDLPRKWSERPPYLAVEVKSPSDRMTKTQRRIGQFLNWGTAVVWLVDYEERSVTIYRRNQYPQVVEEGEELTGGDELPEFRCAVADLFFMPGQ
jgi:Uma2 family endonuclease